MPALENFVDTIGRENFLWNDSRQINELKDKTIIYKHLRQIAPYGYKWVPTHVGRYPNGIAYVAGALTISDSDGSQHTVSGFAEGATTDFGINGVGTDALANAVLRGLGCAEHIYGDSSAPVYAPQPAPAVVHETHAYANSEAAFTRANDAIQQQAYGNTQRANKFPDAGASRGGPWTGQVKIKTGTFQGTKWADLPYETVKQWAEGGNSLGIKEMDRRMIANGDIPQNHFRTGGQ